MFDFSVLVVRRDVKYTVLWCVLNARNFVSMPLIHVCDFYLVSLLYFLLQQSAVKCESTLPRACYEDGSMPSCDLHNHYSIDQSFGRASSSPR